jgi:hypothetical protein
MVRAAGSLGLKDGSRGVGNRVGFCKGFAARNTMFMAIYLLNMLLELNPDTCIHS